MKAKLQWLKNGADVEEGQNVYLWENIDKSYEYVPKDGAVGLEAHQPYHKGSSITKGIYGNNGNGRETGSGGQGAGFDVYIGIDDTARLTTTVTCEKVLTNPYEDDIESGIANKSRIRNEA